MSQEGGSALNIKDPPISNGGPDIALHDVPQADAAVEEINTPKQDTENATAEVDINKDASSDTDKPDVLSVANGIADSSASTAIVPTEADLEELEKAAQTKEEVETPKATEESEAIKGDEDDDISVKTEESEGENSSEESSESDSDEEDSDSDESSNSDDDSSSSSSSSEDPSVIPDMDYDEERAILTRDQVYPQSSLMYGDDDEPIFSPEDELRHAFEFRFGDRATVRKMITQRIKGKRRQARGFSIRSNGSLGPGGRKAQRDRVNQRKKRALYAIIAAAVITVGASLVIYSLQKEREYNRSQEFEDFGSDFVDIEKEGGNEIPTITITNDSPNPPQMPITASQPQPQQSPATPPTQIIPPPTPNINDSELLSLIKSAYVDTFQSIPGTSGTNQAAITFVNEVKNNYLNPEDNSGQKQSYQWKAYNYLYNSRTDVINKETNKIIMPAERIMQIYALYCFYLQVQFPQEGTNECEWSGVTCQDLNDQGNAPYSVTSDMVVVSLELPKWRLEGTLPSELAFLPYIESINLSNNQLSGPLPTLAMFKWKRLKVLSLHDNQFESGLSSEIGHLTSLQKLTIYHNQFQGESIPAEVCHLREGQLHFLWVDCSTSSTSNFRVSCPEDCCTICFEPVGFGHDSEVSTEIATQLTHETHGVDPNGVILSKLKAEALDGGLNDLDSFQYKSYVWLVTHSSYEGVPDIVISQKYALGTLYFALKGAEWYQNTGWLTDEDVCSWYGVPEKGCNNGLISSLDLSENNLDGEIPLELMSMQFLQSINFSGNSLYGVIPSEIGRLENLKMLLLDNNFLRGRFPDELGTISTLEQLTLNSNQLKGEVPVGVCSLPGLIELWTDCLGPEVTCECCTKCFQFGEVHPIVEEPSDTNPLPDANEASNSGENPELKSMLIKHMTGLEENPLSDTETSSYKSYLWLASTSNLNELDDFRKLRRFGLMSFYLATTPDFSWKIDSGWKTNDDECTWYGISCDDNAIVEISLPSNRLSGTIPSEFALAGLGGKVSVLDLSENSLGGSLPSELGDFHNLNVLDLKFNAFTGIIPAELKHLTKLISLRLHSNKLEGAMPAEVCSLRDPAGALTELSADCDPNDQFDKVTCDTETCCTVCY